jgi:hypothetical protein
MAEKTADDSFCKQDFEDGISLPTGYAKMPVIDYDYYLTFLEKSDAPIEQKRELIEILFNIMMGFADIAFGLSAAQNTCGQPLQTDSGNQLSAKSMIKLEDQPTIKQFKNAAKGGHE